MFSAQILLHMRVCLSMTLKKSLIPVMSFTCNKLVTCCAIKLYKHGLTASALSIGSCLPVGGLNERQDDALQRRTRGKNIYDKIFSELHSDSN